ncbi:MAG TPA: putative LPS assembly protein LptD [Chitinophagaceae bacterium]|nr:putative LPS assembly protein LptD [Chitinophagaceae bacterium]
MLFLNNLTSAQAVKITYSDTSKASKALQNLNDTSNAKTAINQDSTHVPISTDKLDFEVKYMAKDSIVYDADMKKLMLFNKAEISYDDIKVSADYVEYLQDSSLLSAFELKTEIVDTSKEKPRIFQGNESSIFSSLYFNFKSKRALIENAYSQYGEGFILSQQVKRNNDNSINGYRNVYTTCDQLSPHFGIAAKKIKIIPNKVAVTGPANLVIEDIPTPLFLPFGLFPLKQGQRSGFKLPTYDMSENLGFGLREGGYYFAINDHVDLLALADIYALGTYRVGLVSNYNYRYRFNGNFSMNYAYNKIGEIYEPGNQISKNFFITWNHTLNQNVLPGSSFSANVNIGSSRYQVNNSYDADLYLNNVYTSNISYSKTWKNKPFNFSAALRHSQNTQTRLVNLTLPELNFSVIQFSPFQFRKDIVKPRWYEKINVTYQFRALNRLDFYDSVFNINHLKMNDFNNGFVHSVPINANYSILKFFNLGFNTTYNEYWYTRKMFKQYNFNESKLDTTLENGFFTARDFGVSANLSTRIYGIKMFKKGSIKGIRHVLTPTVSLRYNPDFGGGIFNYYYTTYSDQNYTKQRYSYYEGALLGMPADGKVAGVSFDLGNTLQMKIRDKKDTVNGTSKLNLIDGLNIRTFYNIAADSFKWSNVGIVYRNTFFDNILVSANMSYSLYAIDKTTGRLLPTFEYNQSKKWMRFDRADLTIGGRLPLKRNMNAQAVSNQNIMRNMGMNYENYADFNIPWSLTFNYSLGISKRYLVAKQNDTIQVTQDVNFNGDVNLASKWKIGFRSGYDFNMKKISLTTFDIYRDLHCWEMRLNITPFGYRKSFNFTLNVKSTVLQDLKLVKRKDFRDNF